jgi:hypothetical protein
MSSGFDPYQGEWAIMAPSFGENEGLQYMIEIFTTNEARKVPHGRG